MGVLLNILHSRVGRNEIAETDAFGRLRVSEPITLFDSKQLFDKAPLFWDDQEISGASTTSTHDVNEAMTTMGVAATTAGNRVRQTFMRFNYQPGKSQLVLMTGVLSATGGGTGISRCMGLYDDENGIFYQDNEGMPRMVIRSKSTGSVVDTAVAQADWNLDKLDGSGPSALTLDMTKVQILLIDMEWLGVGTVRAGFIINGHYIYVHEFHHANIETLVYMSTPNLPLRYEIDNDGTGAASTLGHICATVISEGGQQDNGLLRYASTEGTHVVGATENVNYGVLGIRLKSTHLDETVNMIASSVAEQSGNKQIEWSVTFNPTVASLFTYVDEANSACQIARGVAANTVTGGTQFTGGYFTSTVKGGGDAAVLRNALRLGSSISGTRDQIVLCARPIGGAINTELEGSLTWRELS